MGDRPVPEQQAAIEDRDRDLFLSAGAGSGKTTVLVRRFCDVVCADAGDDAAVGVENVLAFTFTERAAGELTRRIRAELLRRASDEQDPGRARRLRGLARDSESAWISTIHSFCRRLLASHPLAAGLDPRFRVLDETEAARIGADAFDVAFRRFGEVEGDDRFEMAAAFGVSALRAIAGAAHDELRSRGARGPELPEPPRPDVAAAVAELREAAEQALAAARSAGSASWAERCRDCLAAALAGTARADPPEEDELAEWKVNSSAKALDIPEVHRYRAAHAALERRLLERRFAHHFDYLRELLALYADEYALGKEARSGLDYEDLQLHARELLESRPDLRDRYGRQFRHIMVDELQDTNALQLSIVRLIHEDAGGAARNRLFTVGDELQSIYGFRHADVEVFRSHRRTLDAAPKLEAGVRRLAGNFRSSPGILALVNRVGGTLFGPRYEELTMGAAPEGDRAPAAELLVTEKDGWEESEAANDFSRDERAQPWRLAEARFLAGRLGELHREGTARSEIVVLLRSFSYVEAYERALEAEGLAPYVVGGRGYWSKQQVADVRNLLACVANPLDEKALFGALASPACGASSDALWLLRHAAWRRPAWTALHRLYGPARASDSASAPAEGGGPDDELLVAWREREQTVREAMPDRDSEALRSFVQRLLELRAAAPRLSLEALIDCVTVAFDYDLALLMRRQGRRRMANVRKLMRMAREFEADDGRDLRGFLDFVDAEVEGEGRESEAAVDAEGHDGVRVMTVHAAKGLEFPVVAVADLGRRPISGFPPALRLDRGAPEAAWEADRDAGAVRVGLRLARLGRARSPMFDWQQLEVEAVERDRQEERRIAHVAMTRAERRLLLSGAFPLEKVGEDPKDTDPLIATVLRALAWKGEQVIELEPPSPRPGLEARVGSQAVSIRVNVPGAAAVVAPAAAPEGSDGLNPDLPGQVAARPLPDPDLRPPAAAPTPPVRHISYSALALYERCGYRFYVERVLGLRPRLPDGREPGAAIAPASGEESPGEDRRADEWHRADDDGLGTRYARGRVVHELLERSARDGFRPPAPEHAASLLRREGVRSGEAQVGGALALVGGFLESSLCAELGGGARVHPEVPFAFRAGELVVRGEIDLLADLDREILVVDYKSDALDGAPPGDQVARYEVQRQIYALAALRRYGRPVRVAYVFLERPDEPVESRFAPADAERLSAELASIAEGIVAGRFEVTMAPERPLCVDCPAREHLCSYGPERTLSEPARA